MLATRIQQQAGYISPAEWEALMSSAGNKLLAPSDGRSSLPQELEGSISFSKVLSLDNIIHGLVHSFTSYPEQWRQFIESSDLLGHNSV